MLRSYLMKSHPGQRKIRWRLHEPSRIEALTDSVFAFAVTLIVISLEVPQTFRELLSGMRGLFGFAICFTMLMLIWYEQYLFFRKYGLQDLKSILLNGALLFIVLFYVYPLKFLFGFLTEGNSKIDAAGNVINKFTHEIQIGQLMIIYGGGFIAIYIIFLLMYMNAFRQKDRIQLNNLEIFNTRTSIFDKLLMIGIGILSVIFAILGVYVNPWFGMISGMTYSLIGITIPLHHHQRNKLMKKIFSPEEIEQVSNEILIIKTEKITDSKQELH